MSDIAPVRPRIVIDVVTNQTLGGGNELYNCYFLATNVEGVYNLYTQHSRILAANIVSGQNFNFTIGRFHFYIQNFEIDDVRAKGEWTGNPLANEPDGSFQAQAGGGVPVDETVTTFTPPADAIIIKTVTGGSDKDKLKKCYFLPAGSSQYTFYDKDGNQIASGLTNGTDFTFPLASVTWSVTSFVISDTAASGDWSNPNSLSNEQDGSFQAQAGGGLEEPESASAVSA